MPGEVPAGVVDGVNASFTTTVHYTDEDLTVDRFLETPGVDYTYSGTTLIFLPGSIPPPGASLYIRGTVTPPVPVVLTGSLLTPTPYALIADMVATGITSAALGSLTTTQQQAFLDEANALIDSYIGAKYTLPLVKWGPDLRRASVALASFAAISMRGFDPEDEGDKVFQKRSDETIKWLIQISKGEVTPVVQDSTPGGKGGAGGNNFTTQARTTSSTTQAQLDGQVTINSDPQAGQVIISRPTLRGW